MTSSQLRLETARLRLDLTPEVGGSVSGFDGLGREGWTPIFRRAAKGCTDALNSALYPLVPFFGRIRGGAFVCDGRRVILPPNMAGDLSPIHGEGWRNVWTIQRHDGQTAELAFLHEPGPWPWRYEARLNFALAEHTLRIDLSCKNLSSRRMPCGLGLHPFFNCGGSPTLSAKVSSNALADQVVCGRGLDDNHDGWSGEARVVWPRSRREVLMTCADATRLQVYAPPSGDFVCVEPVQNAIGALTAPQAQWPALGITLLDQGESTRLAASFEIRDF